MDSSRNLGKVGSGKIKNVGGNTSASKTLDSPKYSDIKIDFSNPNKSQIPSKEDLKSTYNLNVDAEISAFEPLVNERGRNKGFKMQLEDGTIIEYDDENSWGKLSGNNPSIARNDDGKMIFQGLSGSKVKIEGGDSVFTFKDCGNINFKAKPDSDDTITLENTRRMTLDAGNGNDVIKVIGENVKNNRIIKTGGNISSEGKGENVLIFDFDNDRVDDRTKDKKSVNAQLAEQMQKENDIFRRPDWKKT